LDRQKGLDRGGKERYKTLTCRKPRELKKTWGFLTFLGKAVVNGQDSDIWEFGKGALSTFRFCGVAVGKRLDAEGKNIKYQRSKSK